jgi:hypothetical protein
MKRGSELATIHVADIALRGEVLGINENQRGTAVYLQFMGESGPFSVLCPNRLLVEFTPAIGDRVELGLVCKRGGGTAERAPSTYLEATAVRLSEAQLSAAANGAHK